jgi:hypothetical protein
VGLYPRVPSFSPCSVETGAGPCLQLVRHHYSTARAKIADEDGLYTSRMAEIIFNKQLLRAEKGFSSNLCLGRANNFFL